MAVGGFLIFLAAEMRNPLKVISAGFLLAAILGRGGLWADQVLGWGVYISVAAVTAAYGFALTATPFGKRPKGSKGLRPKRPAPR
jgi:hypothetical protein